MSDYEERLVHDASYCASKIRDEIAEGILIPRDKLTRVGYVSPDWAWNRRLYRSPAAGPYGKRFKVVYIVEDDDE